MSVVSWEANTVFWGAGEVPADSVLVLDLDGERLDLTGNGWQVLAVDLGSPVMREVVSDVAVGDGTDDHTAYVGGRNILISLHLAGVDRQVALDELAPYLAPGARPTLEIATESWRSARTITVRHTGDLPLLWERPSHLEFVLGFRSAGSPYFLGDTHTSLAWPAGSAPGRTYDLTYPRIYPSAEGFGSAFIDHDGNRPANWVARIFGPITGPRLILTHGGDEQEIKFDAGFEVGEGDYIEIDSQARTVLLNSLPGSPRYSDLDFSTTEWWRIPPGNSSVRLDSSSYTIPAQAEITYSDTYW